MQIDKGKLYKKIVECIKDLIFSIIYLENEINNLILFGHIEP